MSTRQPAQASIQATIQWGQTPSMTVSHPTVVFGSASADVPIFQIITLVCPPPYAPISLSTDAPDYFTLATDAHPRFAPDLTILPSSLHSYVHIRYVASKRGHHTGQLTIRNGDEVLTVALTGQRSVLMAQGRPFPVVIRRPRSGSFTLSKVKKPIAGLLMLLAATGLAYLTYTTTHRPSSGQRPDAELISPPVRTERPVSAPTPTAGAPGTTTHQDLKLAGSHPRIRPSADQHRPNEPADELAQKPVNTKKTKPRETAIPAAEIREPAGLSELSTTVAGEAAQKRRNAPSEESDLERELNRHTRNPLN